MPRFDPEDFYGHVTPTTQTGAVFYQNGHYFDSEKNHINLDTGRIITPFDVPEDAKEKPKPKQQHQPRKSELTTKVVKIGAQDGEEAKDDVPAPVDLDLWYAGQKYPWFKVKRACFDAFGSEPKDAAEAREMIAKHRSRESA